MAVFHWRHARLHQLSVYAPSSRNPSFSLGHRSNGIPAPLFLISFLPRTPASSYLVQIAFIPDVSNATQRRTCVHSFFLYSSRIVTTYSLLAATAPYIPCAWSAMTTERNCFIACFLFSFFFGLALASLQASWALLHIIRRYRCFPHFRQRWLVRQFLFGGFSRPSNVA